VALSPSQLPQRRPIARPGVRTSLPVAGLQIAFSLRPFNKKPTSLARPSGGCPLLLLLLGFHEARRFLATRGTTLG